MKIYAIPGETVQHIGKNPDGGVLMSEERPTTDYICVDNGDGTGSWEMSAEALKRQAAETMIETLAQGYEYDGVVYQCELDDINKFNLGLTTMNLNSLTSMECRAMDNSMHVLTDVQYKELCSGLATTYETALRTYWAAVDAIGV